MVMTAVTPVPINRIRTRNNLMQSRLWAVAKRDDTTRPLAFITPEAGTVLVLLHQTGRGQCYATIPWGPEPPSQLRNGIYLEQLARAMRRYLPTHCIFLRFDLPWESPWEDGVSLTTRELEMNYGTTEHNLRKAPMDGQPVTTLVVDLDRPEDDLLGQMKAKTRYNISLARRRGVRIHPASPRRLDQWFELYRQTMQRHGKTVHRYGHFARFLDAARQTPGAAVLPGTPPRLHNVRLLLAERDGTPVAGMILAVSGDYAIYLYGASSTTGQRMMPSYLLQWRAMQTARRLGARRYDLFGIPPDRHPGHPMHGLLRFKEGFGGQRIVRRGCWDYPFNRRLYTAYAGREAADPGYHGNR